MNNDDDAQSPFLNPEEDEKFKDVSSDTDSEASHLPSYPRDRRRTFYRTTALVISLITLLGLILYLAISTSTKSSKLKYDQCGTTAEEARARGCIFEITGFSWVPPECYDLDTEQEFLAYLDSHKGHEEFGWYRDMNYTEEVDLNEVRQGNTPGFFVRQQYHLTHCLFLLMKRHRFSTASKPLDGLIEPLHHTEHCVGQLLKSQGFRKDDVQLSYVKFPYCGRAGGYNVEWEWKKGRAAGWTDH